MTSRRTRNPDSPPERAESTLEHKIDRIEDNVLRAREDVARLTEEIHRDVERLRAAAAELPPLTRPSTVEEPAADLQSRVAALVAAELTGPLLRAEVNRIVDARFQGLTQALQQKMQQNTNPLQGLQLNTSRKRR